MVRAFLALLLALLLTGPAAALLEDEQVLVRIGDEAFDPTDSKARDRFGMIAESSDDPVGWVLQFHKPLTEVERNRLGAEYGLSLEAFVPDQAYLVWMRQENIELLAATENELYRGHVRYGSSLRLPAWLGALADSPGSVQLRITPFDAIDVKWLSERVQQLDPLRVEVMQVRDGNSPRLIVEMPLRLLPELGEIEGVRRIEDLPFRREDRGGYLGLPLEQPESRSAATGTGNPPRHWTEVFADASFGRDSNVELVGDGSTPTGSKRDTHGIGSVGVDYRRTRFNVEDKAWEMGLEGQTTWIDQQDINSASRFDYNVGGYVDWSFRPINLSDDGKLLQRDPQKPRYSAGLLFRHEEIRLDEGKFTTVNQTVLGGSVAFSHTGECELNRIFAFVSFEDVVDRQPESDPALDRDGHNTGVGIRGSLGPDTKKLPRRWQCQGGGTFRKVFLESHRMMHGSYQHRWENTYGTEFRRRVDLLRLEGHWPLLRRVLDDETRLVRARLVLDVDLSYTRANHTETSIFEPKSRSDNVRRIDAGLIFPLVLQSEPDKRVPLNYTDVFVRIGAQYTDHGSNVDVFDYERTTYGVNLRIVFGHQNLAHLRTQDPDNPGSTDGDDSGSGPTRPQPNGGIGMSPP